MFKKRVYFDCAAGISGNPSSPHQEGRYAKQTLENARTTIARLIEVQPDDIIFTSGATESNALALLGHIRALRANGRSGMHVLYLPSAHASIVENIKLLTAEGVTTEALPIKNYRVDAEVLAKMLRDDTVLVAMDAVCGETGVVWNTREVAEVLKRAQLGKSEKASTRAARPIRHAFPDSLSRALLHIDASQAPFTEKISRAHFDADMLTLDASKIGTTRGIGVLIAHRTIPIAPLYVGGGQERGLRSGSEAGELAKIFAADLCAAVCGREQFRSSAEKRRAQLIKVITDAIPNVYINGSPSADRQAPHILNLSFPDRDTDYLVALLDEAGFAVSTRSACETVKPLRMERSPGDSSDESLRDSEEGSRAVFALTDDRERARSTLRISWGPRARSREFARFVRALTRAVTFIDNNGQW